MKSESAGIGPTRGGQFRPPAKTPVVGARGRWRNARGDRGVKGRRPPSIRPALPRGESGRSGQEAGLRSVIIARPSFPGSDAITKLGGRRATLGRPAERCVDTGRRPGNIIHPAAGGEEELSMPPCNRTRIIACYDLQEKRGRSNRAVSSSEAGPLTRPSGTLSRGEGNSRRPGFTVNHDGGRGLFGGQNDPFPAIREPDSTPVGLPSRPGPRVASASTAVRSRGMADGRRKILTHQRQRHVVDRDSAAGAPFGAPRVRVAVEDGRRRVAIERLLQPAASEEREDLRRLALDGGADRRVVEDGDLLRGPQPRQGRLQLQRLVDGLLDELLDRGLAPGPERPAAEAAGEPLDPGESDAADLAGVPVEQDDAGLLEDLPAPRPAGRIRSRGCRAPRRWESSRRPPSPRPGRGPPRGGRSRSGRRRGPGRPLPRRPARRGPGRSRGRSWCSGGRRPPPGG